MNIFDSHRLLITPLSPVHIGTGDDYEPTHYVIEDGVLHEFDTGAAMRALTKPDRQTLLEIGNRKPDPGMIQAVQRFFFERRKVLMAHAVQRIPVSPGVAKLYAQCVGQTANLEAGGGKVLNKLEIDRTAFNPVTRLPVLFGSSLKGALRTALLDGMNRGKPLQRKDEKSDQLQQRLFQFQAGKFELDPLRLVQLSDAPWAGEPGLPAAQVHLAVNRKKTEVKDAQGQVRKSQAESKDLYQILECLPAWRQRAFTGQLNVQRLDGLGGRHTEKLPDARLRFDAAQLAHACNTFYLPILQRECDLLRQRGYLDSAWDQAMGRLLTHAKDKMAQGEVFLLRVGRHSGAESVTLNGVRHIKIIGKQGAQPEYLPTTKTLWLAADDKEQTQNLIPFGWLLVEVASLEQEAAAWPELQALCQPYLDQARAWAAKVQTQETQAVQLRQETEARQRQEEDAARVKAEQVEREAKAEAERLAQLAALSDNLRRVQGFEHACKARAESLRGKLDKPFGALYQQAKQLADAAQGEGWSAQERAATAQAIAHWLPKVETITPKTLDAKLDLARLRGQA